MDLRRCLPLLLAVSLFAGCGDNGGSPDPAADPPSPAASSSSATRTPYEVIQGPLARCGPQPAAAATVDFEHVRLRSPAYGVTPAITAGHGRTVVVLLHQTDNNGLCGWLGFAPTLVEQPGVALLALDLCGYGESRCRTGADPIAPVAAAVEHARTAMRADKVVLLGASMGGSVALIAATRLPGIATAVDLSGPVEWRGMEEVRQGRALPVPVLVAMADDEGEDEVDGARRIVANAPRGSELVPAEAGHGYELLLDRDDRTTSVADRVLSWIAAS